MYIYIWSLLVTYIYIYIYICIFMDLWIYGLFTQFEVINPVGFIRETRKTRGLCVCVLYQEPPK